MVVVGVGVTPSLALAANQKRIRPPAEGVFVFWVVRGWGSCAPLGRGEEEEVFWGGRDHPGLRAGTLLRRG